MPRKVDPRWGEDGYEDIEPLEVSRASAASLAATLGFDADAPQTARLRDVIEDIGSTFRRWHGRGAGAFTRAEARAALEHILSRPSLPFKSLSALNERAFQELHDHLEMLIPAARCPEDGVYAALMRNEIDEASIRQAARNAIEELKAIKGPDPDGEIAWCAGELCRLYEELTGKPTTLSNKEGRHYTPNPGSEAGRFVQACFRLIDPSVGNSKISHAMRHYLETPAGRSNRS